MNKLVPIDVLRTIELIYDVLNERSSEFSLFETSNAVNFDVKLNFVKKLTSEDVSNIPLEQKIVLSKILNSILREIDSKFYQKTYLNHSQLSFLLNEFQSQLINLIIRYEEIENRVLLHYSQFPTYSRDWNRSTKFSRGLVIDLDDYSVVVHPYDKFFNYLEAEETKEDNLPNESYEVSTKLDGSEGILYPAKNGEIRIITKGSFDSEQGRFATTILYSKYTKQVEYIKNRMLYDNYTLTFEIIYSQDDPNRIVVAYDEPDLKLIGVKDLKTGRDLSYLEVIDMAKTIGFPHTELEDITLEEILEEREKRENFEGWVVRFKNGLYMKIKCSSYLELHGARFGSSIKSVFNLLKEEKWDDFIASVPEEIKSIPEALQKRIINFIRYYTKKVYDVYYSLPEIESQKEFAIYVNNNVEQDIRGFMFKIRADKEINVFEITWMKFKKLFDEWELANEVNL